MSFYCTLQEFIMLLCITANIFLISISSHKTILNISKAAIHKGLNNDFKENAEIYLKG